MEKIELIKEFLNKNSINWDGCIYDKTKEVVRLATEKDFNIRSRKTLMVNLNDNKQLIAISADIYLTQFVMYGIDYDYVDCYLMDEDYQDLFEKDLSKNWIRFCAKRKGLIYQLAVEKVLKKKEMRIKSCSNKQIEILNDKINTIKKRTKKEIDIIREIKETMFNI